MKIISISKARVEVPRPRLKTPKKGDFGDLCHEEQAKDTDIRRIMKKYAGNLEEMLAWRSKPIDNFDATAYPVDLQEALENVRAADQKVSDLAADLGISREEVIKLVNGDNSVLEKLSHEKEKHQSQEVQEDLPPDRVEPTPEKHGDK